MARDLFIKIDDIQGESVDAVHGGEIEIIRWEWGMSQSGSSHSGSGSGAGKVRVHDIAFTKYTDKATPNLIKMCCSGRHFKIATLTVRKAGGAKPVEYVKLRMTDGIISAFKCEGRREGSVAFETVKLNFAAYTYEYAQQGKDGTAMATIPAAWNIATNAPI